MKTNNTKKALVLSTLALLLCVSMLVGTTFAWFTDSVSTVNNKIVAGNLDVELYYQVEGQSDWSKLGTNTNVFMKNALWEPGHTEVVKLKVVNEGTLALKYQLGVNIESETGSVNVNGDEFDLSDYIKYGIVEGAQTYTRDEAVAAVDATANTLKSAYNSGTTTLLPKTDANSDNEDIVTMVVYMPTTVGNEANYAKGEKAPTINLGINLYATQVEAENDSFGNDYDKDAWHPEMTIFTAEDLQLALENGVDAQLGSDVTFNEDIILTANLDLGGYTLSAGYITAAEDVEIVNGTIEMPDDTYVYAQNGVTVTLENVVIDSDKISAYAATNGTLVLKNVKFENTATSNPVQNYGGTLVMDNVTVAQAGDANTGWYSSAVQVINKIVKNEEAGKYEIVSQANTTINSGTFTGKKALMISAPGGNVTINGGTFIGSEHAICAQFSPQNYLNGSNYKSVVTINGGDFTGAIQAFPAVELVITGGTFSVDPSAYLANGYKAVLVGERYEVIENTVTYATVSTAAELQAALDNAANQNLIVLTADIEGDVSVKQISDLVITVNGDGHKFAGVFVVDGNSATERTSGVTLKNIIFQADSISADACIRLGDGTNATRYTCNVTVEGCTFDVPGAVGVKSYTGGDKNLTIKGCTITANGHSLAQLKGIEGVKIENCKAYSIRGINFNNSLDIIVSGCTIDVQKYAVRFGESANTTVENYEIINSTIASDNVDGDAAIVLRAGATNANLTITNTSITGVIQMTGHENANVTIQ